VEEVRDNEVQHSYDCPTQDEAIEKAINLADEDGLIREDDEGDDFAATHASWTRNELREQLRDYGKYEDGEVTVSIREV
jgi:hypothetical protein